MRPVLILGGTPEARALAVRISRCAGTKPILSLAGVTRSPETGQVETRFGGFGGVAGLAGWLDGQRALCVIDATHPFATQMQDNAIAASRLAGLPHIRLLRPPWPDRNEWLHMPDHRTAALSIGPDARVMLTSGRKDLEPYAARSDVSFLLRTIEPVQNLPENFVHVVQRPPFDVTHEIDLMNRHRITHLVTKNSGGAIPSKLKAAETLRLATLVIARPPRPQAEIVATVDAAVAWLHRIVESTR